MKNLSYSDVLDLFPDAYDALVGNDGEHAEGAYFFNEDDVLVFESDDDESIVWYDGEWVTEDDYFELYR